MTSSRYLPLAAGLALLAIAGCGSSGSGPADFGSAAPDGGGGPSDGATPGDAALSSVLDDATPGFILAEGKAPPAGCQPGKYTGQYNGTFQTLIPTTGPVTITLTGATKANGEFELVTNNGTWDTTWGPTAGDASLPVEEGHATLVGQLDCTAGVFTAVGQNTYFTILGLDSGSFTLTLSGKYDPASNTISGTFSYVSNDGSGTGSWQVTLSD